ncbi:tetratricopeptide repeat protein [Robertkochia flava]|uniref:tetratricopeptide repeat protein n=1 Tax=Robertkochia flava TaxID=3447986 RepID=UPI001CCC3A1B|nr:tetratricopeptide repeat protein [Robertkochia marina]
MKGVQWFWKFAVMVMVCFPVASHAQVEESAELSTELVEDAFQDNFFEALKQKGIGNLDKALNHLVECKRLEPGEAVVDYELGRLYGELKQYLPAEEHLQNALKAEPGNFWYLNAVVQLYLEQEDPGKAVAVAEGYRQYGWEQELLVADLYIRNKDFDKAEAALNTVEFPDEAYTAFAAVKLRLIDQRSASARSGSEKLPEEATATGELNTLNEYKKALESLAGLRNYEELLLVSTEAVGNFPAQPEFYYFRGLAQLKTGDAEQALETAQEGLAYLLDDNQLELAFYQLMKEAYGVLGNDKKRKEIENKIGQKGF